MTTTNEYRYHYDNPKLDGTKTQRDIVDLCNNVDELERLLGAIEYDNTGIYVDEFWIWIDARDYILGSLK